MIYPNNSCRTYGIKSLPEISLEQASEADISSTWHRLWIVNEVILSTESSFEDKTNTTGSCLVFGNIKMNVKAKHMIVNSQSGQLEDAPDTDEQTAAHTFAAMMGNNYDFIANHFPILKQLKELTKCVALAKWLYLHNVPIDIELLKGIVNKNRTNYSSRVPSLTRMMETSVGNTIHKQSIFGGVTLKLSVNPKVISSKTYHDIQQNLDQRQIVVNLNSVGVKAVAISLPFHYNKEEVCCICQSILSWKELQIWHLALHPNYAKVVGNYYLKNSDFLCLLHNPLVCKGCLEPIVESGPFIQDETGCYHGGCKVCSACEKPLVGSYILHGDLSYHEECVAYYYASCSSHSNNTINSYNDDSQKATTDTEVEELDLALAISLSMQGIEPNHFHNTTCNVCTYINGPHRKRCEMCDTAL